MSEDYRQLDPDPVDVLRRIAGEIDYLIDLSGYRPNTEWLREAAVEIERLRSEVAELRHVVAMSKLPTDPPLASRAFPNPFKI